jgi:hypothetical protein
MTHWNNIPSAKELRPEMAARGLTIDDVEIVNRRGEIRLLAGPNDVGVGPGIACGDDSALAFCLDAAASAVARNMMLSSAKDWRARTTQWACTASSILIDLCRRFDISTRDLWIAGMKGSQSYGI